MPLIRLSGSYANFDGNILGVDFTAGVGDVPTDVANLISAAIGPIMEIDAEGNDVGIISFDPRASMILPDIGPTPRTESAYPVDTGALSDDLAALKATVEALPDLTGYAAVLAAIGDFETRITALEAV